MRRDSRATAGGCSTTTSVSRCSARIRRANSLTVAERLGLLDALVEAGLPAARMMPGTGTCALPDTVELTRRAVAHGCGGVLMLPPFYYKDVSDDGLFASYAEVIERVGDSRLRVYLYHIPPVSRVPLSLALIERLLHRYPGTVAGIKDSSGDWDNTRAMLERFQPRGFDVFSGSETFLLATLRARRRRLHQRHGQRESGRDREARPRLAAAGCRRAAGRAGPGARGIPAISDDSRAQGRRCALLRRRLVADRAAAARGAHRGAAGAAAGDADALGVCDAGSGTCERGGGAR